MNRRLRRKARALQCHQRDELIIARNHTHLVRIVAAMVEVDPTVSGATIITREGRTTYVDAEILRRGGRA